MNISEKFLKLLDEWFDSYLKVVVMLSMVWLIFNALDILKIVGLSIVLSIGVVIIKKMLNFIIKQ